MKEVKEMQKVMINGVSKEKWIKAFGCAAASVIEDDHDLFRYVLNDLYPEEMEKVYALWDKDDYDKAKEIQNDLWLKTREAFKEIFGSSTHEILRGE